MKRPNKIKHILYKILPNGLFEIIRRIWQMSFVKLRNFNRLKQKTFTEEKIAELSYGDISFKMRLVPGDHSVGEEIFFHNSYEPEIVELFKKYVTKNMVCLDIGANIGHHSLVLSRLAKKVISFEPNPHIYRQFKESIELNGITNIEANNFALGNSNVSTYLSFSPGNSGGASFTKIDDKMTDQITAEIKKMDNLNLEKVDFVKMDAEGFEWEIIKGGMKTFEKNRPIIVIEYSPLFLEKTEKDASINILSWFHSNEYDLYDSDYYMKKISDLKEFRIKLNSSIRQQVNLFCLPKKK